MSAPTTFSEFEHRIEGLEEDMSDWSRVTCAPLLTLSKEQCDLACDTSRQQGCRLRIQSRITEAQGLLREMCFYANPQFATRPRSPRSGHSCFPNFPEFPTEEWRSLARRLGSVEKNLRFFSEGRRRVGEANGCFCRGAIEFRKWYVVIQLHVIDTPLLLRICCKKLLSKIHQFRWCRTCSL